MSVTTRPHQAGPLVQPVLRPQTFGELVQFANMAAKSSMVPRDYLGKPENIMLAIQMGSELGLSPMQAIQNIAVVNGRPAVWGDAMPGLVKASGVCKDIIETIEGDGDTMVAVCVAHRHGAEPVTSRFSVADAKKAGLWGKQGPWQQYPKRMLQMRARGFALRDAFPDVLRGLISSEEAADIPADGFAGSTINARAEPAADTAPIVTVRQFLDALEPELLGATDCADVVKIQSRPDVQKAMGKLTGAAATKLHDMLDAALARFAPSGENDGDLGAAA